MNKTETTIMPVYNSINLPASWLQKELCRSCYKWGVTMSSEEWSLSEKTHILSLKKKNKKKIRITSFSKQFRKNRLGTSGLPFSKFKAQGYLVELINSQDPKKELVPWYLKISWKLYEDQKLARLSNYVGIYIIEIPRTVIISHQKYLGKIRY